MRDAGPGIPRDQQGRIFEKFGRVDVPGASKPGTGLGLFIARSIAEAHGGSLDVSSGVERGLDLHAHVARRAIVRSRPVPAEYGLALMLSAVPGGTMASGKE